MKLFDSSMDKETLEHMLSAANRNYVRQQCFNDAFQVVNISGLSFAEREQLAYKIEGRHRAMADDARLLHQQGEVLKHTYLADAYLEVADLIRKDIVSSN